MQSRQRENEDDSDAGEMSAERRPNLLGWRCLTASSHVYDPRRRRRTSSRSRTGCGRQYELRHLIGPLTRLPASTLITIHARKRHRRMGMDVTVNADLVTDALVVAFCGGVGVRARFGAVGLLGSRVTSGVLGLPRSPARDASTPVPRVIGRLLTLAPSRQAPAMSSSLTKCGEISAVRE
jgi:hypothetical protein